MEISFLKAGNGDCIYMSSKGHHVIVDSGETCPELEDVIKNITQAGEAIDLLVVSHYDSDHIKAILQILQKMTVVQQGKLVKKVWFNATKVGFHGNEKELSATEATQLGSLLLAANIPWMSEIKEGTKEIITDELIIEVVDGGTIYKREEGGQQLSNNKCDWSTHMADLEIYLNDEALDNSVTNRQSAILVVHANGHKILLPGDATPDKLTAALRRYAKDGKSKFDLIKMPHHGSYKNITKDILEKVKCSDYVITTDGSIFLHPNKKALLKVIKWGTPSKDRLLTFHLNYYDDLFPCLGISREDMNQYKFECDGKRTFEF